MSLPRTIAEAIKEYRVSCVEHERRQTTMSRDRFNSDYIALEAAIVAELQVRGACEVKLREATKAYVDAVDAYIEEYSVEHTVYIDENGDEQECPEDDTCECPLVVGINKTHRALVKEMGK